MYDKLLLENGCENGCLLIFVHHMRVPKQALAWNGIFVSYLTAILILKVVFSFFSCVFILQQLQSNTVYTRWGRKVAVHVRISSSSLHGFFVINIGGLLDVCVLFKIHLHKAVVVD